MARAATAGRGRRLGAAVRDPSLWSNYAAVVGLVLVFIVFSALTPEFFTGGNISDLLVAASILVVLAAGQTFPIAVGGIDLSIGSTLPWAGVLLGLGTEHHLGLPLSIVAAIAGAGVVGLLNGLIITKVRINDFIVTLGSLGAMSGVALVLTSGNPIAVNSGFMQRLAIDSAGPIRYFWFVALVVAVICYIVLFRTAFGTHVLAAGGNREAARSTGVRVDAVRIAAYTISGLCTGLAGVLLVAYTGSGDPSMQTSQLLNSIAAVVLGGASLYGGRASVLGAVAGAVLLTALLNGFTLLQVSSYYQPIATGLVVIAAAAVARYQR